MTTRSARSQNMQDKIFSIYKPKGPTSFDIIRGIQKALGQKKGIGHAGTLDPLASGVLVIGIGREATKKLGEIVGKEKEYIAKICLGKTSSTDDEEGEKHETWNMNHETQDMKYETWNMNHELRIPMREEVKKVVQTFVGEIMQTPPIYSALKVAGKTAYSMARKGQNVELKARPVLIRDIEVLSYEWPFITLRVETGPGVYIRALARDIGEKLGVGGYLAGLERTRVGEFSKDNSLSMEEAIQMLSGEQGRTDNPSTSSGDKDD